MSALGAQRVLPPAGGAFNYFWLIPAKPESIGEFRALRSATQGSALRTRKPFEKGLSESFISPAGGTGDWCGAFGYPQFLSPTCGELL
ncbi:hypothetical protein B5F17_05205 [Butyricicoccus pullicaecorum]|uniref:Uncharacterized protein n=1 Tax=Butyricicoccus pullicaecorum TaxID=501571 RepID=A0A1Y4L9J5_9FIRM|nr:hypothetical protein B5F17_05205 [Butyricicoccus pullicaecorum]